MKIIVAHARYRWPGGEETTIRNQQIALEEAGHEVVPFLEDNPSGSFSSVAHLAASPFNPLQYRRMRRAIRENKADVLHVHNTWFALSASVIKAGYDEGIPVVQTLQNYRLACPQAFMYRNDKPCTECVGRLPIPGVRYGCYRGSRVLSLAVGAMSYFGDALGVENMVSKFIVPSRFASEVLIKHGLPAEKVVVSPNAVPDPGPRPTPPSQSKTVVFVGRLSPEKGLSDVLQAWGAGVANGWQLEVFGDGPLRDELEAMAGDGVSFRGRVNPSELHAAMHRARLLVFPSRWFEVCPLTILEAFASGLPVVGYDIGAVAELLRPLGARFLVPLDLGGKWDRNMGMMETDEVVDLGGENARREYERRFSLGVYAESLSALYRGLIR